MTNQGSPVTNFGEFCKKYGTRSVSLLVEELIQRAPEFKGDVELARHIGEAMYDITRLAFFGLAAASNSMPYLTIDDALNATNEQLREAAQGIANKHPDVRIRELADNFLDLLNPHVNNDE